MLQAGRLAVSNVLAGFLIAAGRHSFTQGTEILRRLQPVPFDSICILRLLLKSGLRHPFDDTVMLDTADLRRAPDRLDIKNPRAMQQWYLGYLGSTRYRKEWSTRGKVAQGERS